MEKRIFLDKTAKPTEGLLKDALGKLYADYLKIVDLTYPCSKDWVFTKSGGWILKIFDKKKALLYLIPSKNEIKISLAIRENERDILREKNDLDESIQSQLETAKKYVEGYALQFYVTGKTDYAVFEKFIRRLIELRTSHR
jgi:hypothetical protein